MNMKRNITQLKLWIQLKLSRLEWKRCNRTKLIWLMLLAGKAGFGDFKSETQIERRYDVQFEQKIESINGTFN